MSISETIGTIKDNLNRNAKKDPGALIQMPEEAEPVPEAPRAPSRLNWTLGTPQLGQGLPQIPSYDAGTDNVPDDQIAQLHQGEKVVPASQNPDNPDNALPRMNYDRTPSQEDQGRQLIEEHRNNADDLMDAGAKKGSLAQVGTGVVLHNTIDRAEDRMAPDNNPRMTISAIPRMKTSDQSAESAPRTSDVTGAPVPAPTDLIQTKPEMPAYIGQERIGKGTPGEKQLIEDRQTKVDELKHTMTYGTREEAANAQEQLARLEKGTPWGSPSNRPGLLGKIGHIASEVGQAALRPSAPYLLPMIPGTQTRLAEQEAGGIGKIKELGAEKLQAAETAEKQAAADAKETKSPWKPAAGEQFTQYDATGKPIRQLYTNENTGEQQWRDVPAAGVAGPLAAPAGAAPAGAAPAAGGEYYGTKESLKTSEKPIGDAGVKQYAEQAKSASLRVPRGYDVAQPTFTKDDTGATAADKVKDYERSVNDSILADRSDKAQAARESAAESRERRAEDRKDKGVPVYAEDENGQTILTNKYMAQLKNQAYEIATPGDINKDRQATRQLNDVQLNVSRYTRAATEAAKTEPTSEDYVNMHSILNKAGALDLDIAIGEGGSLKIPVLSSMIEGLNREVNSEAYHDLSPQAKSLVDGYIRSLSAVPAYQKALTGIGRSNKEMLDLELANIPNPTMKPADIQRKLGQFQENIDRATEGFPKLPGLKTAKQTRSETENQGAPSSPRPEDVVKTGKLNGKPVYQLKNGKTVDAQGNEVK